jgi:hypothetical protein
MKLLNKGSAAKMILKLWEGFKVDFDVQSILLKQEYSYRDISNLYNEYNIISNILGQAVIARGPTQHH